MEQSNSNEPSSRPKGQIWIFIFWLFIPAVVLSAVNSFDLLKSNRLDVDNVRIDGNTISSTNSNGNLTIDPNGTGGVLFTDLTANTVPYLDASKIIKSSSATDVQLGYLANASSNLCGVSQSCTLTNKVLTGNTAVNLVSGSGTLVLNTTGTVTLPNVTGTATVNDATQTLTNKTIDADSNTVSNIENADIKAAAAIAVNKLAALTASRALVSDASGFVSAATTTSTEIGYVNGVTSSLCGVNQSCTLTNKVLTNPVIGGDSFSMTGSASGTVSVKTQAAAGTYNFNLPTTAGSTGQVLTSQGGGASAMTWTSPLTNPMTTAGDIVYSSDGSGTPARRAIGSTAQILTVVSGVPNWQTGITGVTDGSSASSGLVGEYVESTGSGLCPSSGAYDDITSISLTAGDWDVYAQFCTSFGGTATGNAFGGIGTASGNNSAGLAQGDTGTILPAGAVSGGNSCTSVMARKNITSTTTYYLKESFTYSSGSPSCFGKISARRVR